MKKKEKKDRFVYVVNYSYDYAGESTEAVYSTLGLAENHPNPTLGAQKIIHKLPIITK